MHLVCFLASIKILTAKTNRDYTYVKVIAALELLAAASFRQPELLCVSGIVSAAGDRRVFERRGAAVGAVAGERNRGCAAAWRRFRRRLGTLSAFLFGGILFLTAGMFFVLPRTARAALDRFVPQRYFLPGFSNGVTLGQIGEIKKSSVPVMHIAVFRGRLLDVRWHGATLAVSTAAAGTIRAPIAMIAHRPWRADRQQGVYRAATHRGTQISVQRCR